MKEYNLITIILFMLITLACNKEGTEDFTPVSHGPYKIMPLGDSRVDGSSSPNGYKSYRYDLWKNLIDNNWSFDFIGFETDPIDYPLYINQEFDKDHAGYGGYRSSTILDNFTDIIDPSNIPDIVLLGIGGNDLTGGSTPAQVIDNIRKIVDFLQALNPEIAIIIEQIAPAKSNSMDNTDWEILNDFNMRIVNLTIEQNSPSSPVLSVNMAEGWIDDYLLDRVHYTSEGAKVVADRYFEVLSEISFN